MTTTIAQKQTYTPLTPGGTPALGSSGPEVSALQTSLNQKNAGVAGYTPLKVDGKYGPLTQAASTFAAPKTDTATTDPLGGVRRYTGTGSPDPLKTASDQYYNNLNTNAPDEASIRAKALSEVQTQIDAINSVYAGLVSDEGRAGETRLGKTRSTAARSGTLGSDFGNADLANTEEFNQEKVRAIKAEQAGKIADILASVNTRADERVKAEKEQYFKNSEAKLNYMKQSQEAARTDLKALASTGISLDKLSQEEYNTLIEQTGFNDNELKAAFVLAKPKADIIDKQVVGNKYYQISKDPITGKVTHDVIDLGFTVPPNYKPQQLDDGTLIFTPDKVDPTKPLNEQVIMYGHQGQFAKPREPQKETETDFKKRINQTIANDPDFAKGTPEDQAAYIRSLGGTPYDFGY